MEIKILYENKYFIAVEKQSGIPSQPDKTGDEDLKTIVEKYCKKECFIINRIDRPVGGLVLFAKDSKTASILSDGITSGKTEKYYYAVVCGNIAESGYFEDYMIKDGRNNISSIADKNKKGAKKAVLEYNKIKTITDNDFEYLSLVEIKLLTGRHHQIRVQFSSRGYGLYGDTKYNKYFYKKHGYYSTALWSGRLKFQFNGENFDIKSTPNGEIFEKFGF